LPTRTTKGAAHRNILEESSLKPCTLNAKFDCIEFKYNVFWFFLANPKLKIVTINKKTDSPIWQVRFNSAFISFI